VGRFVGRPVRADGIVREFKRGAMGLHCSTGDRLGATRVRTWSRAGWVRLRILTSLWVERDRVRTPMGITRFCGRRPKPSQRDCSALQTGIAWRSGRRRSPGRGGRARARPAGSEGDGRHPQDDDRHDEAMEGGVFGQSAEGARPQAARTSWNLQLEVMFYWKPSAAERRRDRPPGRLKSRANKVRSFAQQGGR